MRLFTFCLSWFCLTAVLSPAADTGRFLPHLTPSDAALHTYLLLENTQAAPAAYTLHPYAVDGQTLAPVHGRLGAGETRLLPAADLLGADASHLVLQGDGVHLRYFYGATPAKTTARIDSLQTGAAAWHLSGAAAHTHLAVVNTGDHPTPVWVHQRDAAGHILASARLTDALAPMAKGLYSLDAARFAHTPGARLEVVGDQHLMLLALRGGSGKLTPVAAAAKRTAESSRDDLGIWFITGGTLGDVFEMMGYNVAVDRMWQGELLRRTALGRLSEVFGASFVAQDVSVRRTNYSAEEYTAAFAGLSAEEQTVISAYVAGFNRRIAELRADPTLMPFEFVALGITNVEDWTPEHVLAWAATLQHQFTSGFGASYQISYLSELQHLIGKYGQFTGASMFLDLHWTSDPHALTMVPGTSAAKTAAQPILPRLLEGVPDVRELAENLTAQEARNRENLQKIGAFVKGGSYAWVVSGDKTASGNPILYSGPQLENPAFFQAPGIVQEGSIRGGGINVSGLVVTGVPAVIVGRTPHHAWSFQVGHANNQDLYFENPANITATRTETVHVAGGEDVTVEIRSSTHGQIINDTPLLALKSAQRHYEFSFVKATLGLARAEDMDAFGDAVADLAVSMHLCYADRDGNIAYWHSGRQPVRPHGSWLLPQGTIAAPLEWDAAVVEPLVHDRNTPRGFYGGWNNKASADYEDSSGSFRYTRMHRAHTIVDYLSAADDLTYEEVAGLATRIATTRSSLMISGSTWAFLGEFFEPVIRAHPTPERLAVLDMLETWNGQAVAGSPDEWAMTRDYQDAWVVQDTWMKNFVTMSFGDEFDTPAFGDNLFGGRLNTLLHLLDPSRGVRKSYNWFRNDGDGPSGFDAVVTAALDKTLADLGPAPWGEGARPLTVFNHALLGDLTALVPALATPVADRATYAQCVELDATGPIRIGTHFVLGQSGDIRLGADGNPAINPAYFGMAPYLAGFGLRSFPLFD